MLTPQNNATMAAGEAPIEYRFSGYRLDTRQRKLFNPQGETLNLSSRAFHTLQLLLAHQGQTLAKSRLMELVWPNVVVEENNLSQAIYSLRKALGDTKVDNNYIRTVSGRGYCFVAPVEVVALPNVGADVSGADSASRTDPEPLSVLPLVAAGAGANFSPLALASFIILLVTAVSLFLFRDDSSAVESAATVPPTVIPATASANGRLAATEGLIRNSIAVLPFITLNSDSDHELFALGLHDEVINQLTRIKSLNVIARNSVLALTDQQLSLTDIGRVLRVESMMSGTIMFVGDQARISLQMLDSSTGVTLWAGTYEANKEDIAEMISIQSDIAEHVATALEAEIALSEMEIIAALPTTSFEAYRFNLAAKNAHFRQDFAKEWSLSRQATELDPDYFDAFYSFAAANSVLISIPLPGMTGREHFELTLQSAERMIALAPQRSEGYAQKAVALGTARDWEGVARQIELMLQVGASPADMKLVAALLMCLGDFDKAIEIYKANLVTEPVNLFGRGFLMAALELSGKREQARKEYEIGEELSPAWWGDTVNVFLALGRNEPLQDVEELVGVSSELKHLLLHADEAEVVAAGLEAYKASPNKIAAEAVYVAAIAAHSGDHESAVEVLRTALDDVWTSVFWLWLPVFDDTRQLASFRELLSESGIVEYWQQHGWPEVCQPQGDSFTCDWKAYP